MVIFCPKIYEYGQKTYILVLYDSKRQYDGHLLAYISYIFVYFSLILCNFQQKIDKKFAFWRIFLRIFTYILVYWRILTYFFVYFRICSYIYAFF
jgi:hypothetical protein